MMVRMGCRTVFTLTIFSPLVHPQGGFRVAFGSSCPVRLPLVEDFGSSERGLGVKNACSGGI